MKKALFIIMSTMILMGSCIREGQLRETTENFGGYEIEKLFTVDSITVYRFWDDGHYHYFTNKTGTMMSTVKSGKTTRSDDVSSDF